jgi:C4-type Zn-finger protein
MARLEPTWPAYFYAGKKPLVGSKRTYRYGDLLEIQTKEYARAIAAKAGTPAAIRVVNVRSSREALRIAQLGLKLDDATKSVEAA